MTTLEYSDIAKLEQRNRNVKKNTITTYILKKVNLFQHQYNLKWVFAIKQINQWSDAKPTLLQSEDQNGSLYFISILRITQNDCGAPLHL